MARRQHFVDVMNNPPQNLGSANPGDDDEQLAIKIRTRLIAAAALLQQAMSMTSERNAFRQVNYEIVRALENATDALRHLVEFKAEAGNRGERVGKRRATSAKSAT